MKANSSRVISGKSSPLMIFTASLVIVTITGYLLMAGRSLLIPIVVAILIWHLLNTINAGVQKLYFVGKYNWLSYLVSFIIVGILIALLVNIISSNVSDVLNASSKYQKNLTNIFAKIDNVFHIKAFVNNDNFIKNISVQSILINLYGVFSTLTSSTVLIILYVAFLFVEQHFFQQKLGLLFPHPEHLRLVDNIINHIVKDTQTYLGLKTFLSLIVAVFSWMVMKIVGLDFAAFWAILIFFLNFIPNIGAIVATVFPSLFALIQFGSWFPFIIITSTIVAVQFIIGNLIEPRFLGNSLNLSPLVLLFALAFWGAIWGILGMFLAVPITVMMMIFFAHFSATRPLAIILSQDGYVHRSYADIK